MRFSCLFVAIVACGPSIRPGEAPPEIGIDAPVGVEGCPFSAAQREADEHHCGDSCTDCTVCGGTCRQGHCTPNILAENVAPMAIAVDATHVYWQDALGAPDEQGVYSVNKTGGPRTLLATDSLTSVGIAVDADHVYWSKTSRRDDGGSIMRSPLAGGKPAVFASSSASPTFVTRSASSVVWSGGGLFAQPVDGGGAETLDPSPTQINSVAGNGDRAYYSTFAVDGVGASDSQVRSVAVTGGPSSLVADCKGNYCAVAVAGNRLCITSDADHSIVTASPPDAATAIVATGRDAPGLVVADATACYWDEAVSTGAQSADLDIFKVDVATGHVSTIATTHVGAEVLGSWFAVDDQCLYYGTRTGGDVPTGGHLFAIAK